MTCEICARSTHEWYDCPKKSDGYVPIARRVHTESTASKEGRPNQSARVAQSGEHCSPMAVVANGDYEDAGSNPAPPVDTIKRARGRPASIPDMKAYKANKAREYRARDKQKGKMP